MNHHAPDRSIVRIAAVVGSLLLVALLWLVLLQQHDLLWKRLRPEAAERFAADQVNVALPPLADATVLEPLCPESARQGRALAQCLADRLAGRDPLDAETARTLAASYDEQLRQQIAAARLWAAAYQQQSEADRRALRETLARVKEAPAAAWQPAVDALTERMERWGVAPRHSEREAVGSGNDPDAVVRTIMRLADLTQSRIGEGSTLRTGERAVRLGLLASGRKLLLDYGHAPPRAHLMSDADSLAQRLESQRRAQGYVARGARIDTLAGVLPAQAFAALVLLAVVALVARGRAGPVLLWGAATGLLGLGALVLTDLSLTGPLALRYLAERQFVHFSLGGAATPLMLAAGTDVAQVRLWAPFVLLTLVLALLGLLRHGGGRLLAPLRAWVAAAGNVRWSWLPATVLLGTGAGGLFMPGAAAAVSEALMALACLGLATYTAREAAAANVGAGLQRATLAMLAAVVLVSVGLALMRGDLGHAIVAIVLVAAWAWLFGGVMLRSVLLLLALVLVLSLLISLVAGAPEGPLAWLLQHLPPHGQQRFEAMFDPFGADSSDLARIRWLAGSAGLDGWGLGYVPWQGLAPGQPHATLPLQGPSDYLPALLMALWGRAGGAVLLLVVMGLFAAASWRGLHLALRPGIDVALRLLSATGGFGCLVMASKALLSVAGVTGVLPLTGVPVALIGYGPVTQAAALMYLALAVGLGHVQPATVPAGVRLRPAVATPGTARQRAAAVVVCAAVCVLVVLALGQVTMRALDAEAERKHVAQKRLALTRAVAAALRPQLEQRDAPTSEMPCDEMTYAVAAWNERLRAVAQPVRLGFARGAVASGLWLDVERLKTALGATQSVWRPSECRTVARALGRLVQGNMTTVVDTQAKGTPPNTATAHSDLRAPSLVTAREADFSTGNAWWGLPGCLFSVDSDAAPGAAPCSTAQGEPGFAGNTLTDPWLLRDLEPPMHLARRQVASTKPLNGRKVDVGAPVALTLDARWQTQAQLIADCWTGRQHGEPCAAVLPADTRHRTRYFETAGQLRAGAVGLVLADVDSGRVIAMAGSLADCTVRQMGQLASSERRGTPALLPGSPCPQLPDRRSAWLAGLHPALWPVPPGSAVKELAVIAGVDAGLVGAADEARWKRILAESEERLPVQQLALDSSARYLQVLRGIGFDERNADLLWGRPSGAPRDAAGVGRWPVTVAEGTEGLRATTMPLTTAERIRAEKLSGVNVDKRHGATVMAEFLAARRLADTAVGAADLRVSAVGLVELWRRIDLRARGAASAPALHLLERNGVTTARASLDWASPAATRRALAVTSGVTAAAWSGTAQGSCRVVFGSCPAEGLPGLSAKTGTSDFLADKRSPWVKPGLQVPAKLFAGVFTAPNGRRYAVAAMALRVRDSTRELDRQGMSRATLELESSAPAEAALTLMRQMGVSPTVPAAAATPRPGTTNTLSAAG